MFGFSWPETAGFFLAFASELAILLVPWSFHIFPRSQKRKAAAFSLNRIAAVICAHNEGSTIGGLLTNLKAQTRTADAIYVIADNCSDQTAEIARNLGATVLEKGPSPGSCKAYALQYAMKTIPLDTFDGLVFFDADTMPKADFIEKIAAGLNEADLAIGFHTFEARQNSWAEAGNALLGHVMWHHYYLPRYRSGVHSLVLGMGYAVRRSFLERLNWTPRTLTEDLALSLDAVLDNADFVLCPEAQFQDKQPENWIVSWHRMRRWMTGDLQCLNFYGGRLAGHIARGNWMTADFLFFLFSVPLFFLKAAGLLLLLYAACRGLWGPLALTLLIDLYSVLVSVCTKKRNLPLRWFSIPAFCYLLLQIPWIALSSVLFPSRHWVPGREAPYEVMKKTGF